VKVVFSAEAEADFERIGDYIAKDNPWRALSFVQELHQTALSLADAPRAFPLVPRYEHHGIRRRVFGNYLIFYCVGDAEVAVLHILHAAMDYEPILFPGG
jgi:toxin ParE1/3/4